MDTYGDVRMDIVICGPVGNEELEVLIFDLAGRRSDVLVSHGVTYTCHPRIKRRFKKKTHTGHTRCHHTISQFTDYTTNKNKLNLDPIQIIIYTKNNSEYKKVLFKNVFFFFLCSTKE